MDALMAAFVAALLAIAPDRAALAASAAANRTRTIAAALLIAVAMAVVSVLIGLTIAPSLSPAPRLLMLAAALALIGIEFVVRRLPEPPARGMAAALIGSGLWFVVATLAMRSALPWLIVPGAVIGVMCPIAAAAVVGADWSRLPLRLLRRVVGVAALAIAAALGCVAIGIV